jgi:hypothetical protein
MMATIFAWINLCLGAILAVYSFRSYRRYRSQAWAWISVVKIVLGVYWAGIYIVVLLTEPGGYDSVLFGQVFIRPALTITLAVMAAASIMGTKR